MCRKNILNASMLLKSRNIIFPLLLLSQTIYCWVCFYNARLLEYDDNYGLLIQAFIISLVTLVAVAVCRIKKTYWRSDYKFPVLIWLLTGSPITFIIAGLYYQQIFNTIPANWSP